MKWFRRNNTGALNFNGNFKGKPRLITRIKVKAKENRGGAVVVGLAFGAAFAATTAGVLIAMGVNLLIAGALSVLSSMLMKKPESPSVLNSMGMNGHLINTKNAGEPVKIVYGTCREGCNWVFAGTVGPYQDNLYAVTTFGEGVINGWAPAIDTVTTFEGSGINDLTTGGTLAIAPAGTWGQFVVKIDGVANPNTFTWSDDAGYTWDAAGVVITGAAQALSTGVTIKFDAVNGHTLGDAWSFYVADYGLYCGDRLYCYYVQKGKLGVAGYGGNNALGGNTVNATLKAAFPLWDDGMIYTAYILWGLVYDQETWKSIPDLSAVVEGVLLSDPVNLGNPKTFSANPAWVVYDLMTNTRYGMGIPAADIDATSFGDIATWCTANSYTFNGIIGAEGRRSALDVLEDVLLNFRGYLIWTEGKYYLHTYSDDASVMALTVDDIEEAPESFSIHIPGIPDVPNKVKTVFINAAKDYTSDWQGFEDPTQTTADGEERVKEVPLNGTTNAQQAANLAKYYYYRAKYSKTVSLLAHPRCMALEPGDMVTITHEFTGWSATKFRVKSVGMPQEGLIPLVLVEEDSTMYADDADVADTTPWRPPHPTYNLAAPTNPNDETGEDTTTFNRDDAYLELRVDDMGAFTHTFEYKESAGSSWRTAGIKRGYGSATTGATTLTVDAGLTLSRAAGDFVDDGFRVGQQITISGFTNTANNTTKIISAVTTTLITVTSTTGLVAEAGGGDESITGTITVRAGGLPTGTAYVWRARTHVSESDLFSPWLAEQAITTWARTTALDISGATLTASPHGRTILLRWS